MPLLGTAIKQPAEIENYSISYANDLDSTDTFTVSLVNVISLDGTTTGLPVVDYYMADTVNKKTKMLISGGTAGSIYKVTVRIVTDTGRVLEDEFKLKIKDY